MHYVLPHTFQVALRVHRHVAVETAAAWTVPGLCSRCHVHGSPQHGRNLVLDIIASASASVRQQKQRSSHLVWAARTQGSSAASNKQDDKYLEGEKGEWHEGEYEEGDYDEMEWEEGKADQWQELEEEEAEASSSGPSRDVPQIPMGQKTVPYDPEAFVEVGLISRPHGIKGEVKVQLLTDEPKKRLGTAGKRLWLQQPMARGSIAGAAAACSNTSTLQCATVQWGRVAKAAAKSKSGEWAVKFQGIADRNQAELLAGHKLLLALCDREAAPKGKDEFFITDLVGMQALCSESQQLLGVVTEVYDTAGSYNLLRIRLAPNEADIQQSCYRSVLVPFVEDMVPHVGVASRSLQLLLPEGLLDTATMTKLKRPYTPDQQKQLQEQLKQRQLQQGQASHSTS